MGWVAAAAGGYALKRMAEKQNRTASTTSY
jgi:hypothetical protein